MNIRKIIKEEINDFDWAKELKTSNTEKFIDLLNKSLERLPISFSEREDEFSYGWINQVGMANSTFMAQYNTENSILIGGVTLRSLSVTFNRILTRIKDILSRQNQPEIYDHHRFSKTNYEEAREKLEELKDHLDVNLNTSSINQ